MELEQELQKTLQDIHELDAKGKLDGEDAQRMADLIKTGKEQRARLQMKRDAGELVDFGNASRGMLPLVGDGKTAATVDSFRRSGETVLERDTEDPNVTIARSYGEGVYGDSAMRAVRTTEYKDAFRTYIRSAKRGGEKNMTDANWRILNEGSDSEGGYLVPEDLQNHIIAKMPAPTSVMGRVSHFTTSRDTVVMPRLPYDADDKFTSPIRVTWVGEEVDDDTVSRTTPPSFGTFRIPIYTALASLPITKSLLEDDAFGIMAYIKDKMSESVELTQEIVTIAGTGQGQPTGILSQPGGKYQPPVIVSGQAATLGIDRDATVDLLNEVAFDIPEQYDANSVWVFNKKSTGRTIAGLRDDTGRPLWGSGLQEAGLEMGYVGRPLIGYPTFFNPFMDDIGANKYPIMFGDLKGYYSVARVGFSVQVLTEKYAESDQVVLLGRFRIGGATGEPWRLRAVQCHT